jgi:hypothetical protein
VDENEEVTWAAAFEFEIGATGRRLNIERQISLSEAQKDEFTPSIKRNWERFGAIRKSGNTQIKAQQPVQEHSPQLLEHLEAIVAKMNQISRMMFSFMRQIPGYPCFRGRSGNPGFLAIFIGFSIRATSHPSLTL